MKILKKSTSELFKVTGNWELQSKALKVKFPNLTDSDLKFETGRESALLSRIRIRLKKKRQEVINMLNNIIT
jgi:hypothetical protein